MQTSKPRIIKRFEKLDKSIKEQIKLSYPEGFSQNLLTITKPDGSIISVLPYETEDTYYMVRMSEVEAASIIDADEDYDNDGVLKESAREKYEQKHGDFDMDAEEEEDNYDEGNDSEEDEEDDE